MSLPILRRCKGCWPGSRSSARVSPRYAACTSTLGQRWAAVRTIDGCRGGSNYSWPCCRRRRARPNPGAVGHATPARSKTSRSVRTSLQRDLTPGMLSGAGGGRDSSTREIPGLRVLDTDRRWRATLVFFTKCGTSAGAAGACAPWTNPGNLSRTGSRYHQHPHDRQRSPAAFPFRRPARNHSG